MTMDFFFPFPAQAAVFGGVPTVRLITKKIKQ